MADRSSGGGQVTVDGQNVNYNYFGVEVDWANFDETNYEDSEKTVIEPQLKALGFDSVSWHQGPNDETRLARCVTNVENGEDQVHWFLYTP